MRVVAPKYMEEIEFSYGLIRGPGTAIVSDSGMVIQKIILNVWSGQGNQEDNGSLHEYLY